ncbi:trehalose-6-phosphate synthase [Naumannella sp. ID2617S]|nr:trehalose-6-phosphate synthase [Naumannella sp. ID2617S]
MARKTPQPERADFVVVANRLPVDRVVLPDGTVDWRTSPGGLVTALEPVMHGQDGAWVGWHGAPDETLEPFTDDGLKLVPVPLSTHEVEEYYEGFSNATLWPLYHDGVAFPEFHREWWDAYLTVNRRFAEAAAGIADDGATVWVQDYQLQLVPQMLRERRPDLRIGFFLHIPFPPTELFLQLPWRREIVAGLLGADLIGFQLPGGAQNFLRLARGQLRMDTKGDTVRLPDGRTARARAYPISIDARAFEKMAGTPEVVQRAEQIHADLGHPKTVFLGVDRLDYTKGIKQRIRAFGELIAEGALDPEDAAFVQVATPSRERVEEYKLLRDEIDRLVGQINGDTGRIGRPPITYLHSSFPREEMAALYTTADIMVVTPLRDGMNLVAKEFVACRRDGDGALVLSEFAGAAKELKQAYLVNPYDINGLKASMMEAASAPEAERKRRMRAMRKQVFENDIDRWADRFLTDLKQADPTAEADQPG